MEIIMPRSRDQARARYAASEHKGAFQVVDQLHGYALGSHPTRPAAEAAARALDSDPTAAIAAVEHLDAAQTGPAAKERRTLRRYGYAWSLRQDEMLSRHGEFSHHRLKTLASHGHLAVVFTPVGLPFYTTPEQYEQLPIRWVRDGDESFPAADRACLERPRPARDALPKHERGRPCELHGITLWRCLLCGPREDFECGWGDCTANRITAYCERCARANPRRTPRDRKL
ncbi:hypothetical protein [Streptomyces spectabilis]|uniref:Uncharacterized protein n=1 Tax=Streptomyces spectabilis TaxID=68270 RepID=A0A7W8B4Z6_STRST|nr:hypothetical protein [Streptomyces spectabilis]MBB5109310.1 hypothetical protein [Streptomyces spectabilis]